MELRSDLNQSSIKPALLFFLPNVGSVWHSQSYIWETFKNCRGQESAKSVCTVFFHCKQYDYFMLQCTSMIWKTVLKALFHKAPANSAGWCLHGLTLQYSLHDLCCLSDSSGGLQKKAHVTVTLVAVKCKILQTPWIISQRLNKCNSSFAGKW